MGQHNVKQLRIPRPIIDETEFYLKKHALLNEEGMVIWSGIMQRGCKIVRRCLHPRQFCTALGVDIPVEEAQRINEVLYEKGEVLLAQVHSHPGGAFHSHTDNNFAITFTLGFISIVVPFFGQIGLSDLDRCGIWIHEGYGKWRRLSEEEVKKTLAIE
jgi:proteasome lid subunit RPN8/RPN11